MKPDTHKPQTGSACLTQTCYSTYEVSAVAYDGPDTIVATDDDDPDVCGYGLYGRDKQGHARWISDHPTRAAAEAAMSVLSHNEMNAATAGDGTKDHG